MRRALCSLLAAALAACSGEPLRPPEVPDVATYTSGAVVEARLAPGDPRFEPAFDLAAATQDYDAAVGKG